MRKIRSEIERVVQSGAKDILLLGETGTGKELVAKMIAKLSDASGRFIVVHSGAISDGLVESELFGHVKGAFTGADRNKVGAFEAAGGGFVFLDEIGEMPLNQQAKLLRVLQERTVQRVGTYEERPAQFRCISATHVNLEKAVANKEFREDLYYRIARDTIRLTPLRERVEDIPELIQHFISEVSKEPALNFTDKSVELLQEYSWPGNVRQLKAVVESLISRCTDGIVREIDVCQLIPEIANFQSAHINRHLVGRYGASLIANERSRFEKAIIQANGDKNKAANLLKMSRATFFRKARDLGLVRMYRRKAKSSQNSRSQPRTL